MNILIIGSGAREHAIASVLQRSRHEPTIFCCGSTLNPGILKITRQYHQLDLKNVSEIVALAKNWEIDFAIVGPELPLQYGVADLLWHESIPTIGPKKNLARIETSKQFARSLMQKYQIDGLPLFANFSNLNGVERFIGELGEKNFVIKADGLMSGKGVKVAGEHLHSIDEAIKFCEEILTNGQDLVIEEKLIGQEFSLMCFCDGESLIPMPLVQDHKRAYVHDHGPNTGGMGSYSDANHLLPFLTERDHQHALTIMKNMLSALTQEVYDKYIGILYGSFIATKVGVKVIEFNARFGDPEALNVLSILKSDFVEICEGMIQGNLNQQKIKFENQATVCKYAVPQGYPDDPVCNVSFEISEVNNQTYLYFAGVNALNGNMYMTGARTIAYVGIAENIFLAQEIAEKEICAVKGPLYHRTDIGTEKLIEFRIDHMRKLRAS